MINPRVALVLARGQSAGIVHARMAWQMLGWSLEFRRAGFRHTMSACAREFVRSYRRAREILECEADTVAPALRDARLFANFRL